MTGRTHQPKTAKDFFDATIERTGELASIEAQDPIPLRFKPSIAPLVMGQAFRCEMVLTIHLDNELVLVNSEIDDVGSDRGLLANVNSIPATEFTQLGPKPPFAIGHCPPKPSRSGYRLWANACWHGRYPHP